MDLGIPPCLSICTFRFAICDNKFSSTIIKKKKKKKPEVEKGVRREREILLLDKWRKTVSLCFLPAPPLAYHDPLNRPAYCKGSEWACSVQVVCSLMSSRVFCCTCFFRFPRLLTVASFWSPLVPGIAPLVWPLPELLLLRVNVTTTSWVSWQSSTFQAHPFPSGSSSPNAPPPPFSIM